jgi:hypothetical protein
LSSVPARATLIPGRGGSFGSEPWQWAQKSFTEPHT